MSTSVKNRRFEFVGGSSSRFWTVAVDGSKVVVRFGRIGTTGTGETKTFADAATAEKHAEKRIRGKIGKGYVEVA